jgi:acetoin utilization deacetylase AcuC-like enzyme
MLNTARPRAVEASSRELRPRRVPKLTGRTISCSSYLNETSVVYAVSAGVEHDWPGHAEHKGRVTAAVEGLVTRGLTKHPRVRELLFKPAEASTVKLVHSSYFVNHLPEVIAQHVRTAPLLSTSTAQISSNRPLKQC